ncbi:MAG TPA: GH25 family lysozyme, partial [Bacteroidia bacterium]|nr:GH25 family lysozyme [Bacteroidia bacterium]
MKKQLLAISVFTVVCAGINAQTILGIDVSQYQGTITWSSVKVTSAKEFAWAKATEGTTITDPDFATNETNGKTAGVVMGAYHFADPENSTATAEANYFLSVAGSYIKAGCAPPALDLEDPPSGPALSSAFTSAQLTAWVQTWMSTVQTATGIAPVIYTDGNYAAYLNSSLSTYGLWIADPDGSATAPPATTGSWSTWEFKQYSWTGVVSGISGNVDMDVYNGDTAAFKKTVGSNTLNVYFTSSVKTGCQGMSVNYTDKSTSTGTLNAWRWEFQGGTPSSSKVQNPSGIVYNTPGTYYVKEVVNSTTGHDSVTVMGYITVIATATLPLVEGFQESFFPPAGWELHLPSPADSVWEHCTHTGSGSSECMYFPANCGNVSNITGERQQLYTPDYSFASATNPKMWFDVAYEPSSVPTYSDTLDIYYSLDCGNTWTMIYSKGGATLCTTGGSTSAGTDTVGGH